MKNLFTYLFFLLYLSSFSLMGMGDGSEPVCGNGIIEYGEDCD